MAFLQVVRGVDINMYHGLADGDSALTDIMIQPVSDYPDRSGVPAMVGSNEVAIKEAGFHRRQGRVIVAPGSLEDGFLCVSRCT